MRKDSSYDGLVQGFQMWMNLRGENKLDPPIFQNARPEALPLITISPSVKAKLLAGAMYDQTSPVDTFGVDITYIDYMLEPGGEVQCPRSAGRVTAFAFVYEGQGSFGSNGVGVAAGETAQFGPSGALTFRADRGEPLGVMLLLGTPLHEPIVQHGPFVMNSSQQIMQAFEQYQRGDGFIGDECEYRLHTADGTVVTKRPIDMAYVTRRR